jgi:hypothetical protein
MVKRPRKRRTLGEEEPERRIGHLLVRFQDKFYFIPSDKIGEPLTDDGLSNLGSLAEAVRDIMTVDRYKTGLVGLEFAMEISDSNAAAGMVIRRRN